MTVSIQRTNLEQLGLRAGVSETGAVTRASSASQDGSSFVGVFLLPAAFGPSSGIDNIGEAASLLGTEVGRWLSVVVVALA